MEKTRFELRPYQKSAINELFSGTKNYVAGKKILVVIPTGGGKTIVANDFIVRLRKSHRYKFLWLSKDWILLEQASSDLVKRHSDLVKRHSDLVKRHSEENILIGVVGDGLRQLPQNVNADVVYTTLQTWFARQSTDFLNTKFNIVIIDEEHWGENKNLQTAIEEKYLGTASFVGLTATPKSNTNYEIISPTNFNDLIRDGYLAKPIVYPVDTDTKWSPTLSAGDYDEESLSNLAKNKKRNQFIVDTYSQNHRCFGKTLIFACNIKHAEELAKRFKSKGFIAEVVHSNMSKDDQKKVINLFKTHQGNCQSQVEILINVSMMTHGINIPDINTIFLVRPTKSEILFQQMIGRGSRLAPGKKTFNIVDFVDIIQRNSSNFITCGGYLGNSAEIYNVKARNRSRPKNHVFNPGIIRMHPGSPSYGVLAGLEYHTGQTFGIEFELSQNNHSRLAGQNWKTIGKAILDKLKIDFSPDKVANKPLNYSNKLDYRLWNVQRDGSCGLEVVSPILIGQKGLEKVHDACKSIQESAHSLGLRVNKKTGTHIHLVCPWGSAYLEKLFKFAQFYEPAFMSMVPPSRFGNTYCISLRNKENQMYRNRYHWLNLTNYDEHKTIEIRLHSGTLNSIKILSWLTLWMRIMDAVKRGIICPPGNLLSQDLPLCIENKGDILYLANELNLGEKMREYLKQRRRYVLKQSWQKSKYQHKAKSLWNTLGVQKGILELKKDIVRTSINKGLTLYFKTGNKIIRLTRDTFSQLISQYPKETIYIKIEKKVKRICEQLKPYTVFRENKLVLPKDYNKLLTLLYELNNIEPTALCG